MMKVKIFKGFSKYFLYLECFRTPEALKKIS